MHNHYRIYIYIIFTGLNSTKKNEWFLLRWNILTKTWRYQIFSFLKKYLGQRFFSIDKENSRVFRINNSLGSSFCTNRILNNHTIDICGTLTTSIMMKNLGSVEGVVNTIEENTTKRLGCPKCVWAKDHWIYCKRN